MLSARNRATTAVAATIALIAASLASAVPAVADALAAERPDVHKVFLTGDLGHIGRVTGLVRDGGHGKDQRCRKHRDGRGDRRRCAVSDPQHDISSH